MTTLATALRPTAGAVHRFAVVAAEVGWGAGARSCRGSGGGRRHVEDGLTGARRVRNAVGSSGRDSAVPCTNDACHDRGPRGGADPVVVAPSNGDPRARGGTRVVLGHPVGNDGDDNPAAVGSPTRRPAGGAAPGTGRATT
jgi:hypothetical protein